MASRAGRRKPVDAVPRGDSRTQAETGPYPWARQAGAATLLYIHARPGAKTAALVGLHGERLKVAVDAPPVDGKANDALLAFIARQLGCRLAQLRVQSGSTHRDKCVRIEGSDATAIAQVLLARLPAPGK